MSLWINPALAGFSCPLSGKEFPTEEFKRPPGLCPCCEPANPLLVRYDLESMASDPAQIPSDPKGHGIWRFAPLLPVHGVEAAYGADVGGTPTVRHERLGSKLDVDLWIKSEATNPSGSFKDRGLAVAVAMAHAWGAERFCLPTQGNAGVAASLFSARLGLPPCVVYMPEGYQDGPYHRAARHFGADVRFAGANIAASAAAMREALAAELESGAVVELSTFFEPGRLEGKKTMGLELVADLGATDLPEVILYPTGGGTGLVGIWKAIEELRELGVIPAKAKVPRLYAVQSEHCQPVVRAYAQGLGRVLPVTSKGTIADGLDVPGAIMGPEILRALRQSRGGAVSVTEDAIQQAFAELGREGVPAGYESAALVAALRELLGRGDFDPGARVLLLVTSGPAMGLAQST